MKARININRRKFLKTSITGSMAGTLMVGTGYSAKPQNSEEIKIKSFRRLGRTGFQVSDISMGAGNLSNASVLKAALDMGINYIDTAEHYGRGTSERTIGEALKAYDRSRIFITSKLNLDFFGGTSKEELKTRFHQILERLQTNYVDCLMIHMAQSVEQIKHKAFHEMFNEMKAEGKVKFLGLSNHGPEHRLAGEMKEPMDKVVMAAADDGRFDVVLFVYNFIQKEQGERILKACKEKDMGTTLMKVDPISFYGTAMNMVEQAKAEGNETPERIVNMINEYETFVKKGEEFKKTYGLNTEEEIRDASIKFVISNPDVHAVCPTMNSFESLETFVKLSGQQLSVKQSQLLEKYKDSIGQLYCRHACGVCEPACPHKVPVNTILRYNHYFDAHKREKHSMEKYAALGMPATMPCETCKGDCIQACPYGVPAQTLVLRAAKNLTI